MFQFWILRLSFDFQSKSHFLFLLLNTQRDQETSSLRTCPRGAEEYQIIPSEVLWPYGVRWWGAYAVCFDSLCRMRVFVARPLLHHPRDCEAKLSSAVAT